MLARDGRTNRARILVFMAVLHTLCHGLLSLLTPLYVVIQHDFNLARVEPVTALSTWLMVTFAVATLGAGWLVDRVPGRLVAGCGLILQGLGLIALASAPTLGWARFWLVVSATGAAAYHPVSARHIIGLYPEAVGRAMGLAGMGAALGFWLGPKFAGWRTQVGGWCAPGWNSAAWRATMFEGGLVALAVACLYLLLTAEPELVTLPRRANGQVPVRRDKWLLLGTLGLLAVLVTPRDFSSLGVDALNSLFLQRAQGLHLGVGLVGTLLGYKGLISLVTNPLMAWLSDRGQRLWWWSGCLIGSAVCCGAVPYLPPQLAAWALVLGGMLILANYPIFEAAMLERVPARLRGRAMALVMFIVGIFSAFAPAWVGRQVDRLARSGDIIPELAFRPLYGIMGACLLVSLLAVPVLDHLGHRGARLEH